MHKGTIVLLCIASIARADGNAPPTKSKDSFVELSNPRGVIIPAAQAPRYRCEVEPRDGFYTPTVDDVRRFERRLTASPPALERPHDLRRLVRHYFGVRAAKRRIMRVFLFPSFILDEGFGVRDPMCIQDGGCSIVHVEYDLDADKIVAALCNPFA